MTVKFNLMQGDCLERMKEIPDGSVDMVLTDLPYGTTSCAWDEIIPLDKMWAEFYRVIRMNGFIVLTASQPFTTKLVHSNIKNFSHQWVWQKEQGSNPLLANVAPMKNFEDVLVFSNSYTKYDFEGVHPLRPYFADVLEFIGKNLKQINTELGHRRAEHCFYINSTQFGLCTESTYNELIGRYSINKMQGFRQYKDLEEANKVFKNEHLDGLYPRVYNPQKTKGKRYVSGGGYIEHLDNHVEGGTVSDERYPTAVIKFNTDKAKSQHPTQKPVALLEYLIKTYTHEGHTVLDATMGSGSTGVACVNTNRNFIGIELDQGYFDIAKQRIESANENKTEI